MVGTVAGTRHLEIVEKGCWLQGNRVKVSWCYEAFEEIVVPGGDFAAEA